MLPFIGGFVVGGIVGYIVCAVLSINRFNKLKSLSHAQPYDRRSWHVASFPLTDCDGVVVLADRRMQADRRALCISPDA
jgi:hypothetical protein